MTPFRTGGGGDSKAITQKMQPLQLQSALPHVSSLHVRPHSGLVPGFQPHGGGLAVGGGRKDTGGGNRDGDGDGGGGRNGGGGDADDSGGEDDDRSGRDGDATGESRANEASCGGAILSEGCRNTR